MVGYFLILIKLQLFHVFMLLVPFVSSLLAFALFLHIIMQVFFPSHHCCASFYVAITCLCAIFCFCVAIVFYFHTIIYVHVVVSCLCIIVAHIVQVLALSHHCCASFHAITSCLCVDIMLALSPFFVLFLLSLFIFNYFLIFDFI